MKSNLEVMIGRVAAVLLVSGGLTASVAFAQTDATPPPSPQGQMQGPAGGQGGRMEDPDRRAQRLHKALKLSGDQTAQVKAVLVDGNTKLGALNSNTSLAPKDRRTQMMALRRDEVAKLEAILTPDQKTKFEDILAKQRERMQDRRDGGGTAPATAPAPPATAPAPPPEG